MTNRGASVGDPHCRNCGVRAAGAYCAACGQETRVALPTSRQFMREATGRVIAWDGRLWRTLYALVFRPGFLTQAYLAGRRRHYVRPARLFLAMSLILFAVIRFEVRTADTSSLFIVDDIDRATRPGGMPAARAGDAPDASAGGSVAKRDRAPPPFTPSVKIDVDDDLNFIVGGSDNFVGRELRERFNRFNKLSPEQKSDRLLDGALRYGSYVLFVLLPVFAALLKLAYVGRARRYPGRPRLYAEHLVYAAHLHTFVFLLLVAILLVPWQAVRLALGAALVVYVARSLKNVYGGAGWGRLARALFVALGYLAAVGFAIAGLVLASILLR